MHRSTIQLAAACCAIAAVASLPTLAGADQLRPDANLYPAAKAKYGEKLTERYLNRWTRVGTPEAGNNRVLALQAREDVQEGAVTLHAILHPPPAPPVAKATSYGEYQPYPASSGGCPAYMADEADSPSDINPESGAAGCWQVIPSTAEAMGAACADVNSYACLEAICSAQGNDAWSESGATPC